MFTKHSVQQHTKFFRSKAYFFWHSAQIIPLMKILTIFVINCVTQIEATDIPIYVDGTEELGIGICAPMNLNKNYRKQSFGIFSDSHAAIIALNSNTYNFPGLIHSKILPGNFNKPRANARTKQEQTTCRHTFSYRILSPWKTHGKDRSETE